MMMWGTWGGMWAWGIMMWLLPACLIALIVWAVVRSNGRDVGGAGHTAATMTPERDPALVALRQRLATGQISEDEYQRLRVLLQEPDPPARQTKPPEQQ